MVLFEAPRLLYLSQPGLRWPGCAAGLEGFAVLVPKQAVLEELIDLTLILIWSLRAWVCHYDLYCDLSRLKLGQNVLYKSVYTIWLLPLSLASNTIC